MDVSDVAHIFSESCSNISTWFSRAVTTASFVVSLVGSFVSRGAQAVRPVAEATSNFVGKVAFATYDAGARVCETKPAKRAISFVVSLPPQPVKDYITRQIANTVISSFISFYEYKELIKEVGWKTAARGVYIMALTRLRTLLLRLLQVRTGITPIPPSSVRTLSSPRDSAISVRSESEGGERAPSSSAPGKYAVSYEFKGREYAILLKKKDKRPSNKVVLVTHGKYDVTDEFRKWYGPYYDFHGNTSITPSDMGFTIDSLYVMLKGSPEVLIFEPDQALSFFGSPPLLTER